MPTRFRGLCKLLVFFFVVVSALSASAYTREMVRFGTTSYVLEEGSASPDGRFVLAWSVFPTKPTLSAFDWSKWNPENPFAPLEDPSVEPESNGKYVAKSVLLDLEQKRATPLVSDLCYISKRMEVSSSMSWNILWIFNEGQKRVATIGTHGRRGIVGMDLLTIDGSQVKEIPVLEQIWEFARADLKRRKVRNQDSFEHMQVEPKGRASEFEFPIHYSLSPLGGEPSYEKDVSLVLKGGVVTVQATTGKNPASNTHNGGHPSPSSSLAEADSTLNRLYKELQRTLSPAKMASLRTEQRQWIKDRDQAVQSTLSGSGRFSASKEGKVLADQIKLKWTLQRCEDLQNFSK
jgi:uncharacterized protein YecT (DUF1311 family)